MSVRFGLSLNSVTGGGVGGVDGVGGVAGVVGGGAAVPVCIVAGRFGHPTRKRARISRGATRNKLPRRCDMFLDPPCVGPPFKRLMHSMRTANRSRRVNSPILS